MTMPPHRNPASPRVIFSFVVLFAIYAFHRRDPNEVFWVGMAWALTVAFSPIEAILMLGKRMRYEWSEKKVVEGDKTATSGTARAILQGRKYGLGCLLITQRTANVTKTILNQCNTVFAMRTFDETGKEFLANYIGRDYASSLSAIPERHAVLFGKASSCENPILIRLNDRDDFLQAFRPRHPPATLPKVEAAAAAEKPKDITF